MLSLQHSGSITTTNVDKNASKSILTNFIFYHYWYSASKKHVLCLILFVFWPVTGCRDWPWRVTELTATTLWTFQRATTYRLCQRRVNKVQISGPHDALPNPISTFVLNSQITWERTQTLAVQFCVTWCPNVTHDRFFWIHWLPTTTTTTTTTTTAILQYWHYCCLE